MINAHSLRMTNEILAILAELDAFRKNWRASSPGLTPEELSILQHTALVESIGASTRIEGSKLSDRAVDDLLFHAPVKPLATRDAQEVAGYAEVLNTILYHWDSIALTEASIKRLHRDLLEHSIKDQRHRGEYKKTNNHIEAFGINRKKLGIVFKTATPSETPHLMKELVAWMEHTLASRSLHPLLAISIFIIVFLNIHPFHDGHGRLSRLMTTLLLLKHGYNYASYSSLENIIERSKKDYYAAIRKTQKTIRASKPDWQPWVVYFLKTLLKQKWYLESKILQDQMSSSSTPVLSAAIIHNVLSSPARTENGTAVRTKR